MPRREFAEMPPKPPIATVTLAEIYAKQGHRGRALSVLDEVLETEADHAAARTMRDAIAASIAEEPVPAVPDEDPEPTLEASALPVDAGSATIDLPSAAPTNDTLPAGNVGTLEDAPLPERYDVDEVVLMPVDPKTVFVYWEVRQRTADEARQRSAEGRLIVRVVAVTASWERPLVETRDIDATELVGDWFVRDLPVGAVLRAAIGWNAPAGFEPLSVAMDVTTPPASPSSIGATDFSRLTREGAVPVDKPGEDDQIAAAAERARRRMAGQAASSTGGASSWPAMAMSPSSGT